MKTLDTRFVVEEKKPENPPPMETKSRRARRVCVPDGNSERFGFISASFQK